MTKYFVNLNRILRYSFKLICPECGIGKLFEKGFRMYSHCPNCGLKYEREQGYFIGAMYINYGATVLLIFPGYFIVSLLTSVPNILNISFWCLISGIFPTFFYRYSKSLWLNIDYSINHEKTIK